MHGNAELRPQLLRKRLGLRRLRALVPRHIERIPNHDFLHRMLSQYPAHRLQVCLLPGAMERKEWLRCVSQWVRDRQTNPAVPHIEPHDTGNQGSVLMYGFAALAFRVGRIVIHVLECIGRTGEPHRRIVGSKYPSEEMPTLKFIAILLFLLLIAAGAVGYILYAPYGPTTETFVEIAPGTGASAIGGQMARQGIIRSRYGFDILQLTRGGTLKAGEYRFDHPAPVGEVYNRLVQGDVYTRALSIPEGFNIFDIAAAVEAAGFAKGDDFLAAARRHTELIADLLPPGASPESLEGYLFPDTYRFSRHATPLQMLTAMVRRFRQVSSQVGLTRENTYSTVIMASLIEKEVGQDTERPVVAGVFVNRLARSMPLATDPTVIYAALLENRWRGTIYASDLQSASPYNTYRHTGLPPGTHL